MDVIKIDKRTADKFVRAKHYSRKPSIFWAGFGLEIDGRIDGVVVYGQPSPQLQKSAFHARDFKFYELSRLVVQTREKNAASFLISRSLDMPEKPSAVVSYADSQWSHCGIVYQATNWIYTGSTVSHDHLYIIDGVSTHPMTLRDRGITNPKEWAIANSIQTIRPMPKHRYFYLNGSKKDKRRMLESIAYKSVSPYPKCDQSRYDDGENITEYVERDIFSLATHPQ